FILFLLISSLFFVCPLSDSSFSSIGSSVSLNFTFLSLGHSVRFSLSFLSYGLKVLSDLVSISYIFLSSSSLYSSDEESSYSSAFSSSRLALKKFKCLLFSFLLPFPLLL